MGLIDETTAAPAPAASGGDLIEKARNAFEQKVPADGQDALQRIALAGKKFLYDDQMNKEVEERIASSSNPAEEAGSGAVEVLGILMKESRGTFPKDLVAPSAGILMLEILDYLKRTGRIEGTADDIDRATRALSNTLLEASGVTPDTFNQILNKTSESMKDPNIAAQMQRYMQKG